MKIEIKDIATNSRGVPNVRSEWTFKADLTDMVCEFLFRHDPKSAKKLVSNVNFCFHNGAVTTQHSNSIAALASYAQELVMMNHAVFSRRRKEEAEKRFNLEKKNRQEEALYTKLRNIDDETLIEAMLARIDADQSKV